MAAITIRRHVFLLPIKPFLSFQGLYHKFAEAGDAIPRPPSEDDYLVFKQGEIDVSMWKKMDSRSLGITPAMVPASPYTVMQILRGKGFDAYLVGGCVRDLLLKRAPKDFDVITTADLDQISKQFHRCQVVGQRFPVCRVFIKGSVVEVSSFDTLAKDSEGKEKFLESQMPKGCDKLDLIRWKNSMHRDFTVNSLFLDPFLHKIYDYNDGMKDLLELKLRTLVPAQLSFTEDLARILRGLRIAARLGLSLSKEIKSAIFKHLSSISKLSQSRIMMELNYMLSFGAAESSFSLLHKYHLLEILLPLQSVYMSRQAARSGQSSTMLMKLLSHLDKVVACDRPSGSNLWVGLLGLHLAIANNPQHPLVILTLGSVLYLQNWEGGLKFAKRVSQRQTLVRFDPETLDPNKLISDDEIAERVNQLAMLVVNSIDVLTGIETFPDFPSTGLVSIPQNTGQYTKQLFDVLLHKVETYNKGRASFDISYDLLRKGDTLETRFVLGKIILNTIGCGVDFDLYKNEITVNKKEDRKQPLLPSKMALALSSIMQQRPETVEYRFPHTNHTEDSRMNKPENDTSMQELICMLGTVVDDGKKSPLQLESQSMEEKLSAHTKIKAEKSTDDEAGVGSLLWSLETNFKRAIEEVRDSPTEITTLNQLLVDFVEERVQRKERKHLETLTGTSGIESEESLTSVGAPEAGSKEVESNSNYTSETNIMPQIFVEHTQEPEIVTVSKKVTGMKSSVNGERRKQRVCSYCKEGGHNKTGCPKRKVSTNYERMANEPKHDGKSQHVQARYTVYVGLIRGRYGIR